jgi:myosin heavy subunit
MKFVNDVNINENDMAEIDEINEVDLMNNIKNRFKIKNIFNSVGSTIIVINPYEQLESTKEYILENFVKVK